MKYCFFLRIKDWCWMNSWRPFVSPFSGRLLWERLYFGPVEIRRYQD
jgi:hypothetical protein